MPSLPRFVWASLVLTICAVLPIHVRAQGNLIVVGQPGLSVPLTPWDNTAKPPVTNWLLTSATTGATGIPAANRLAWRKLGSKLWTFLSSVDNDFVDSTGKTVPAGLRLAPPPQRMFGTAVTCGRFARQWIRMPFHDCGTYDVGSTGSVGGDATPRWGCNGSLRREVAPCVAATSAPGACANVNGTTGIGVEARFNLLTGAFMPETAFAAVEAKYPPLRPGGPPRVDWGFDIVEPRMENTGFAMSLAFFYQLLLETQYDEPTATRLTSLTFTDVMNYAGNLAVAKCRGPQIEFQPGRPDAPTFDPHNRLPSPTEPLVHTISYFWSNGLTNFDMVNLLAAHSTACFSVGCLDTTPSTLDSDWAAQVMSITSGTSPLICAFPRVDVPNPTPPAPVRLCTLPADAEMNARADVKVYLAALASTAANAITTAAGPPPLACNREAGRPRRCTNNALTFQPFRLLGSTGAATATTSNVNLCSVTSAARVGCPATTTNFAQAYATSYFKMQKMYSNAGAAFDVRTQPCQPGLVQIGFTDPVAQPGDPAAPVRSNPVCNCCPTPPRQLFNVVPPEAVVVQAALVPQAQTPAAVVTETAVASAASAVASAADSAEATAAAVPTDWVEPTQTPPSVAITNRNAQAWAAWYAAFE